MSLPFGWWGCTMATDERARVALYERLDETMGRGAADTLMGYLPPVGWADVATKQDLAILEERLGRRIDGLESRLDTRFAQVDARFFELEARFERAIRLQTTTLFTGLVASVGLDRRPHATVGLSRRRSFSSTRPHRSEPTRRRRRSARPRRRR